MQWYALRVKSRCEKTVAALTQLKGYETLLPLFRCRHRWSDRFKVVELPLFPGYVFCRVDLANRLPLLTIPGVLDFVGIGRTPIPIDESEMAAIRMALQSEVGIEPWPFLDAGRRVRIQSGPLAGVEGFLVEGHEQRRVVASVNLLRRSVAMEIEREWLRPLGIELMRVAASL